MRRAHKAFFERLNRAAFKPGRYRLLNSRYMLPAIPVPQDIEPHVSVRNMNRGRA